MKQCEQVERVTTSERQNAQREQGELVNAKTWLMLAAEPLSSYSNN